MVRRTRNVLAVVTVLLVLAACGSRLDPNDVVGLDRAGGAPADGQVTQADEGAADQGAPDAAGAPANDGGAAGGDAGGTGDTGTTGGDSAAGDGGDDTGGSDAGAGGGSEGGSGGGGQQAASCDGFKNGTGVTGSTITIANVADISGPVPGIFEAAQQGTRAFVDFFNSQNDICGRKLKIINLDSRADAGADQQAYAEACDKAFAAVGSMGAFDSGGAGVAEGCGLPDIRSAVTTPERQKCATCFGTYAIKTNLIPDAYAKFLMKKHPDATANVGVLYINAGAAPVNAKSQAAAWEEVGWKVKYMAGIDTAEFNFAPYVQKLKDNGVKLVVYTGPYQNTVKLQEAMRQQNYEPDVYLQDPTIYDQRYTEQAGDLAEGVYVYSTTDLFSNTDNREMALYLGWLQQVKPGAVPNFYGLYAWSAARLFTERALALGGDLTRKSLVAELEKVQAWTANGLHTEQSIGSRRTPPCVMVIQYNGGKWQKVSPGKYMCGRLVDSGIGR